MDAYAMLAVAEGYGPAPIAELLDPSLDVPACLRTPPALPPAARRRLTDPALAQHAAAVLAAAGRHRFQVLTPLDADYPEPLRAAPLRPLWLFADGDLALLHGRRAVAVVGSRTPTPYGLAAAEDFSTALARAGFVLWSGLALGIDACAHQAALASQVPTVAVLAGGLDAIYPQAHAALARQIAHGGGVLLTEAPPGRRAQRGHFPRRNRILAAAVEAVLVIEAGLASGSLHTARFAAECGVEVFAVPGPYASPRSAGCHALIADGAQIARDPEDLLRRLGVDQALHQGNAQPDAARCATSADEAAILRVLTSGPRPTDLVQREANVAPAQFLAALLALTQKGLVGTMPGDLLRMNAACRRTAPGEPAV